MNSAASKAYDFERFETKPRVVENKEMNKVVRKRNFRTVKLVFMTAVLLALVYCVLSSQTKITELNSQITERQSVLQDEQATGDFLENKVGSSVDMTAVAQYAKSRGMVQMDSTQVNYVTLQSENEIEVSENSVESILEKFTAGFMSIMEYLAP